MARKNNKDKLEEILDRVFETKKDPFKLNDNNKKKEKRMKSEHVFAIVIMTVIASISLFLIIDNSIF